MVLEQEWALLAEEKFYQPEEQKEEKFYQLKTTIQKKGGLSFFMIQGGFLNA